MSLAAPDFRKIIQIAATAVAVLLVLSASHAPTQAQTNHMLVIPASDGYGFDDCLAGNKDCGHVIADAWCEAHGMASAISFGRADDITASTARRESQPMKVDPGSFVVNCKD